MLESKKYRQYAADCVRMAQTMAAKDKQTLLEIAEAWEKRAGAQGREARRLIDRAFPRSMISLRGSTSVPNRKGGAMFATVPLDVWVAAALAAAVGLVAIFGPSAGVFVLIYVCLCAYIIIEVISDEVA